MPSGRGAASGAMSGAGLGSMFGPWGMGIGAGLGGLLGMFGTGGDKPMSPELEALFDQQLKQQTDLNPMYEAVMRLAYSRLPTADRQGLNDPSMAQAMSELGPDLTQSPNGDYNESNRVRKVVQLMRMRQQMANPLYEAIQRMAARRMPRGFGPGDNWATDPGRQGGIPGPDPIGGSVPADPDEGERG